MMRMRISFLLVFVFLFGSMGITEAANGFGVSAIENNQLKIESLAYGNNMRIMVEKDDEKYYYSMNNNEEYIPLQLGDGLYNITLLRNIEGNRYKVVDKFKKNVSQWNDSVYLTSSQPVYWDNQNLMIALADTMFDGTETDYQKAQKAYDYVINNIKYDHNKINTITDSYVPKIDDVIKSGQGICYDYSALFAGLMRSQGIPTKLVKGYAKGVDVYHAWNEVYVNGTWIIVDTTFDAAYNEKGYAVAMAKNEMNYKKLREY